MHARSARRLVAALAFTLLLATPVNAGPPWISVEYPANPFDRATEGALAIVHTYHHGDAISFPVHGTAEGLVHGKRQTIPLDLRGTSRDGVYAVFADLPDGVGASFSRLPCAAASASKRSASSPSDVSA